MRKMQISMDSLCEGVYELAPECRLKFTISYDRQQMCIRLESQNVYFGEDILSAENGTLDVSMMILNNMFDEVTPKVNNGTLTISMKADL